jgi:hypothetical protein
MGIIIMVCAAAPQIADRSLRASSLGHTLVDLCDDDGNDDDNDDDDEYDAINNSHLRIEGYHWVLSNSTRLTCLKQ